MTFLGDLSFLIGTIGVVIYLCLIVVRHTGQASRLKTAVQRQTEQLQRLEQRRAELRQRQAEMDPQVDSLLARLIELRGERDRLQIQYEEMVARSQEREIHIGFGRRQAG
ncbi:MAG: hypothetical protein AB1505_20205 [Candidatus Latescibacterota bacterium]